MSGPWDAAAVGLALFAMVARHEALRTHLAAKDEKTGSYLQKIMPVETVSVQLAMARITVATQLELDEEIARRAQHLFKLADELPFHACLLHMASSQDLYVTFVVHHAVFDAWSWSIFRLDFLACAGRSHGFSVASNLHPLRIQYKEYAQHHRARLAAARRQVLCGWWQDRLESLMPTALVTDYPRPPSFNHTGDDVSVVLDSGITQSLQELARCCRASVYALMLSVFALMLATYTGQPDVAVGIPQTHRTHPEFESVIRFFVDLLVLRVDTRQSSVRALIIHVMQGLVDVQLHQDLPFQGFPRLLGIERDPSRHPVVQTVFNYEAFQEADASPTALQMSDYSPGPDFMGSVAKFDLNATVRETSEGLGVNFNYASTLFERQNVQQWLRTYQYLLQQIALPAVSDMPIDQLSWSPDANTVPHIPLPLAAEPQPRQGGCETPKQMFEREALRVPNLTAVVDGSRALSYEDLDLQTNQLSRYMCSVASLKPDSRVALILDKSLEMIIAILAAWKTGTAYVPLDPAGPPERINHIIKESSPRLVIGHDKFVSPLSCGCPVVGLDSIVAQDAVRQQPTGPVMSGTRSHHLAYIIFTSGTTGQPKGVLVENGGVSQFAYAARRRYFGRASDFQHGVLFLSHYTFDFSVVQHALSVLSGQKLLIPPVDFAARPEFYHQANLNGLTYLSGTPSLLQNIDIGNLQSLRVITVAGEQFLPAQYEKLRKMFAGPIYNAYGITETTNCLQYTLRIWPAGLI